MKTGVAYLPLHYGKAPRWLFERMTKLAREITIIIVDDFGSIEFLRRLSDPFWFQSFGCVLGFDWHSSGITSTVCGALKEAVKGNEKDLGLYIAGGKGSVARKTPVEIENYAHNSLITEKNMKKLIYASKMSAKVDSAALQDGYQIYQHSIFFTKEGKWAVVQQGMNTQNRWARRYHWLSEHLTDFVNEPHTAVCSDNIGNALNMTAEESEGARLSSIDLLREKPDSLIKDLKRINTLQLPERHQIRTFDFDNKRLAKTLQIARENLPSNFESLLGIKGVGPKTIRALALISDLIYGKKVSWRDPARYSFAHGGKDGYPYPVDRKNYDLSIQILKEAVAKARISESEKMEAIRRLG